MSEKLYYDGLTEKDVRELQEGDPVEVIVRSDLYCGENEEPEYHSGVVTELDYQEFKDGTHPIGVWVKFNKDGLYEQDGEELVLLADIEYILKRNYEVTGVAKYQEYMTLSVKGVGIIDFEYQDGSLIPVTIRDGVNLSKREVTEEDRPFISEIMKYGAAMAFSRFVFCGDGNKMDKVKGYNALTTEQKQLLENVYASHMAMMGTEMRSRYTVDQFKEVKWDKVDRTVNVYFKNGDWWHYAKDGTWY